MTDIHDHSIPGPDNDPDQGQTTSLTLLNRLRDAVVAFAEGPVPEDGGACAEQVDVLLDLEDITRTATDVRIGTVDATRAYRVHGRGYKSMNAWLVSGCRMSTYQGAIRARNGRQHRQHPEVFPHIGHARRPDQDPNAPTDPNAPADPDDPNAPGGAEFPGLSPADRLTYEAVVLVFKGTQRLEFALRGRKAEDIRDVTGKVVPVETKIEEYKAILLTLARDAKNLQSVRMGVDYLYDVIDPDGHLSAWERAENRRYFDFAIGDDGCMTGKFCLPPDTAAKLKSYLDQAAKPAGPDDTRTRTQRLADALRAFIESRVHTEAVVLFDAATLVDNPNDPTTPVPDERGCSCGDPHPEPTAPAAPDQPSAGQPPTAQPDGPTASSNPAAEDDSPSGGDSLCVDGNDVPSTEGESPPGENVPPAEGESPTGENVPSIEGESPTGEDIPSTEGESPAGENGSESDTGSEGYLGDDDDDDDRPAEDPGLRTGWGGRPGPCGTDGHDPDGNDKTSKTLQDVLARLRDYDPLRDDPALAGRPVDRVCPTCGQSVYNTCDTNEPGNSGTGRNGRNGNGCGPNGGPGNGSDGPKRARRQGGVLGISPYSKPALMVATGQWIPAKVARRQLLNARITRLILGFPSIPLDHSKAKRLATDYQRRMILVLYDTCCYDDCPVPAADCQLDHPYPWCEYHRTRSDELCPACPFHNGDRAANPDKYELSIVNGLYQFTTKKHWQRR